MVSVENKSGLFFVMLGKEKPANVGVRPWMIGKLQKNESWGSRP